MTDLITKHDAANLANLHADIMVFLKADYVHVTCDIEKTAREYFALTARLGVVLHNDGFEDYVQHFIARYYERKQSADRKAFKK